MFCPRTKTALEAVSIGDVNVYLSKSGGVFFDNRQIFHFSDPRLKPAQVWWLIYKLCQQNALI